MSDANTQERSSDNQTLLWRDVTKAADRLGNFIKKNEHLFTLVGVFGAISVYLTQISSDDSSQRLGELGAVSGLLITSLISFVIFVKLVEEFRIFSDRTPKTTKVVFVLFTSLFYVLFGVIFSIPFEFGTVWDAFTPVLILIASFCTIHIVSVDIRRYSASKYDGINDRRSYFLGGFIVFLPSFLIQAILFYTDRIIGGAISEQSTSEVLLYIVTLYTALNVLISIVIILTAVIIESASLIFRSLAIVVDEFYNQANRQDE